MNNMSHNFEREPMWDPVQAEEGLRRWLEGKFFTCSGCKQRAREAEKEDTVLPEKPECTSVGNATVSDVLNAFCIAYEITVSDIQGTPQSKVATAARRHAMWFLHTEYGFTVGEAGNEVFRDSKSARQAINLVEEICARRKGAQKAIEFMEANIKVIDLLGGRKGKTNG